VTGSKGRAEFPDLLDRLADGKEVAQAAVDLGMSPDKAEELLRLIATRLRQKGRRELFVFVDGASRGNPGPAGIGVVIQDPSGAIIKEVSRAIGESTSNVAEYEALILGLQEAKSLGAESVSIRTDSQLLHHQLRGQYRVRDEKLRERFRRVHELLEKFSSWGVTHLPRKENRLADRLANMAIDKGIKSE